MNEHIRHNTDKKSFSRRLLHGGPYPLAALAVVLAATVAVGGLAMAGTTLHPIAHNYYLDAEYNLDTKVLTVTSKYGNFESLGAYPVDIYDRNDLTSPRWISLDGFTKSGNTITKTLDTNAHNKLNTTEPGIFFRDAWARYYDSNNIPRNVPAGDNSITLTRVIPQIVDATFQASNKTVTVTVDKPVTKVNAGNICITSIVIGVSLNTVCGSSGSISPSGTTVTATFTSLPGPGVKTVIEIWYHAVQNQYGNWNQGYWKKTV